MSPYSIIRALPVVSSLFLLSSCAQLLPPPSPEIIKPDPSKLELYEWQGDGRSISRIEVDIDKQKAFFYDGIDKIGWARVSAGVRSTPTPVGKFKITEKIAEKRSNLYGKIYDGDGNLVLRNAAAAIDKIPPGGRFEGAPMPYFMRLTKDGVGLHGGPIPRPGRPASHGCIRVPRKLAPILYQHTPVGTSVDVFGGPLDTRYSSTWVKERGREEDKDESPPPPTVISSSEAENLTR